MYLLNVVDAHGLLKIWGRSRNAWISVGVETAVHASCGSRSGLLFLVDLDLLLAGELCQPGM